MGYNRENFNRIKQEYDQKYILAGEAADARLREVHAALPEVRAIDEIMRKTGAKIMGIICSGASDAEEQIAKLRLQNELFGRTRADLLSKAGYPIDYTDIKYECEKCGDSGYVDTKMCDCMRRKLVLAGYESSGISKLLQEQTFDNFSLEYYSSNTEHYENMKRNFDFMKNFAETFTAESGKNIALFGETGLGKTHLSSALACRVIERGFDVVYTTAVGLVSDYENRRFGNGQVAEYGNIERYTNCELLVIDDLGSEIINQFTVSCIYNIINTRINKQLSTVISTNLSGNEFRQKYWDRITSRVFGEYIVLRFTGTDIRAQKLRSK